MTALLGSISVLYHFAMLAGPRHLMFSVAAVTLATALHAAPMTRDAVRVQVQELSELGQHLFMDPRLSASGQLACATCHDPTNGFAPRNALPVQFGGPDMHSQGVRAVPSLTYLQAVPPFTEHFFESDDEGDGSTDNGPTGGLNWDGRSDTAHDQVRFPLLSPYEMANGSEADVVHRAIAAGYGPALVKAFRPAVLTETAATYAGIAKSLEVYEEDWKTFYPYSSKYDAYLAGKATLTAQEARGLAAFEDPDKGNCASCHISRPANDGEPPQFTDFGLIAVGAPRNMAIPANKDPTYFDLGVCGPLRTDMTNHPEYCGLFRTPSLRNVALRHSFFHNGVFHSLRDVVAFYVTRDTDPGRWYPKRPDGSIAVFDDLPKQYHANLNNDPPFGGKPGDKPALTDQEVGDIVVFLGTLTDGWTPD